MKTKARIGKTSEKEAYLAGVSPPPNLHARNKLKCGQVRVTFKGGTLPSEEIHVVLTGCNFLERVIKSTTYPQSPCTSVSPSGHWHLYTELSFSVSPPN